MSSKALELRENSGLTMEQVANRIGVSKSTISRIELGFTGFSVEIARRLAGVYGVGVEEITGPPAREFS